MCYDENQNYGWEFETPLQCAQPQEWSVVYFTKF